MGNYSTSDVYYPAGHNNIIAVGATNFNDNHPSYSNYGPHIDVVAPGGASGSGETPDRIISTNINNVLKYENGTSQATAMVTGVVSLMINFRNLWRDDVEGLLRVSADDFGEIGYDHFFGAGRINSERVFKYMKTPYTLTTYPTGTTPITGGTSAGSIYLGLLRFVGTGPNLPQNGVYYVTRTEVRKTIDYTIPNGHSFVGAWGKTCNFDWWYYTQGWSTDFVNNPHGYLDFTPTPFCEVVPGTVPSSNSITLRTYIYTVWLHNPLIFYEDPLGTYPSSSPEAVTNWWFTVLTKNNRLKFNTLADYSGSQTIVFENDTLTASDEFSNFCVRDSTKIILSDSAVLIIPDNYTLRFTGKTTQLKLSPLSKIKFGHNAKLVLDSSARLIANNATFTASDTTKTWQGIFSSDTRGDSLTNCKIINAKGGINFTDKLSQYKTVVKDCEFINKSAVDLDNGIYAFNSDKILVSGNHFYSQTSAKFDNAIYLEYCTSNELNILDNTVEDASNGIVDIGSWSYIARNTLTGNNGSGNGIVLDDYSGIIKYNVINDYKFSLYSLISTPYLYRNSFVNASSSNLELESYSEPLLRPIQSGELKYWYGGDNIINISDEGVGINLIEDSYALLKDGYNKFYLNEADYFITGEVPAEFEDSLEARNNYWNTTVDENKFSLSNTIVKYTPTEDGSAGNRYYNTTILMDIGFGYRDTINIHDESDNPEITSLFILANNLESATNYSGALDKYKEIVASRDTIFVNTSLKKVYHCYKKSDFFNFNYNEAKDYFSSISSDVTYDSSSREVANGLYLKVRFQNAEYSAVEEGYNSIYQNNLNNSLGLHALINKTILENLISDTTDNLNGVISIANLSEHKKSIFNLIHSYTNLDSGDPLRNVALIKVYSLNQNYPNPFNPITKISFDLPEEGKVKLIIYDVTGKEIVKLVNEFRSAGRYTADFNGANLSSGIYFYRLEANNFVQTKRMMLIK